MKPPDPCRLFDQLPNCDSPMCTDFSSIVTSSVFSEYSEPLVLTPWKLKEWKPSKAVLNLNDDHKTCPLGWKTVQLSPLVSAFLPAEFNPGNFDPAILECTKETDGKDNSDETDGTDDLEENEETQDLEAQNVSFDMTTLTSLLSHTSLSKPHSRVHSRFLNTFKSIMGEQESDSDRSLDSESILFRKSTLVPHSTMSAMDILFRSSASNGRTTQHHALGSSWRFSKCRTRFRAPPKSHPKPGAISKCDSKSVDPPMSHCKHSEPPMSHTKSWDPAESESKLGEAQNSHSRLGISLEETDTIERSA